MKHQFTHRFAERIRDTAHLIPYPVYGRIRGIAAKELIAAVTAQRYGHMLSRHPAYKIRRDL